MEVGAAVSLRGVGGALQFDCRRFERCKEVLKWFLIALSGLPGSIRAISAHFEPILRYISKMMASSSGVKGVLITAMNYGQGERKIRGKRMRTIGIQMIVPSLAALLA